MAEGFLFDRATRVQETPDGGWRAEISPRWNIFGVPNGGYLATVGLAGLARLVPHPDLLSVSAYYPTKTEPGQAFVRAETIRIGKRVSTGVVRVEQAGEPRVHLTAMYTDLSMVDGPTHVETGPPAFPPPEECVRAEGPIAPEFVQNFDMWLTPESAGWATGRRSGHAEMSGWVRFIDGRPPDPASMPLFADCLPPAIFNLIQPAWTPTLELTVHVRTRPSPAGSRSGSEPGTSRTATWRRTARSGMRAGRWWACPVSWPRPARSESPVRDFVHLLG